jgi:hypothetical protein
MHSTHIGGAERQSGAIKRHQKAMTQQRGHQRQQSYRAKVTVFVTYRAKWLVIFAR